MKEIDLEDVLFNYIDKIKLLMSSELWNNVLLDCSKNELFILLFIYKSAEVNMTQLAEYIEAPLNTATGVVGRLEKKGLLERQRSKEDKRVVTVTITKAGRDYIAGIIKEFMYYGQKLMENLSASELQTVFQIVDKIISVLDSAHKDKQENSNEKRVKRILIE